MLTITKTFGNDEWMLTTTVYSVHCPAHPNQLRWVEKHSYDGKHSSADLVLRSRDERE